MQSGEKEKVAEPQGLQCSQTRLPSLIKGTHAQQRFPVSMRSTEVCSQSPGSTLLLTELSMAGGWKGRSGEAKGRFPHEDEPWEEPAAALLRCGQGTCRGSERRPRSGAALTPPSRTAGNGVPVDAEMGRGGRAAELSPAVTTAQRCGSVSTSCSGPGDALLTPRSPQTFMLSQKSFLTGISSFSSTFARMLNILIELQSSLNYESRTLEGDPSEEMGKSLRFSQGMLPWTHGDRQ